MTLLNRPGFLTLSMALLLGCCLTASAQTTTAAKDLQNACLVSDIPTIGQISVSWTGECVDSKASGVGDLLGFGAGKLRYILRGSFVGGRLTRIDDIRDCSAGDCDDRVAPSILRQHAAWYASSPASAQAVAAAVAPVPAPAPAPARPGASTPSPLNSTSSISSPVVPTVVATTSAPTTSTQAKVEIRAEDAIYRGSFVLGSSGQISGTGRVEFFDGRLYEGTLEAGRKVGRGLYVWSDGQRYAGNWRDDLPDGEGELTGAKGETYAGEFRIGKRVGKGRMVYADKTEYSGQWQDDKPNGEGTFRFLNGDVYQGQFVAGQQSGKGVLTHANGDRHTGLWLNALREGKGVTEWKDGQRYDGDWRANRKEGQGTMRFADGSSYEGSWLNDQPVGRGVITFASGDTYAGDVRDGKPQGKGLYTWGSGDKFEGEFVNGKPVSTGRVTFNLPSAAETAAASETGPARAEPGVVTETAAPASPATLCSRAYNRARNVAALKKFIESFPEDACERHALARQKIAALEENERKVTKQLAERQAQAKALVGLAVVYREDYSHCVGGSSGACQNVVYTFEVTGKIREVNVARQTVMLQVTGVKLSGNAKGAPGQLFAEGKVAATGAFTSRTVGSMQSKSGKEVGIEF